MGDQQLLKRILIIDDHQLFNTGFSQLLSTVWPNSEVFTAENIEKANEILKNNTIELVFLDINLEGSNGKVELPNLANEYQNTIFIMLSESDNNSDIRYCLNNGARGFIPKKSSFESLKDALNLIQSGRKYTPSCYQHFNADSPMTKQEQVIIKYLKLGKTDKEIASALNIASSTASRHVHNIIKKLNISSRNQIR